MALTISTVPDQRVYLGPSVQEELFAFAPGASDYVTGGYVINADPTLRLKYITAAWVVGCNATALGYTPQIVIAQTSPAKAGLTGMKFAVLQGGGGTVGGNVTVVGGGIGEAIGINPDSNAGALSKTAATNRTIPIATFLGAAPTVTAGASAQVANGFDLTGCIWSVIVRGY